MEDPFKAYPVPPPQGGGWVQILKAEHLGFTFLSGGSPYGQNPSKLAELQAPGTPPRSAPQTAQNPARHVVSSVGVV